MTEQFLTANIHSPRVQEITRHETGTLAITLGNGKFQAHVNVFMTGAEWDALVSEVALWRLRERLAAEKDAGARYCPECSFIGPDDDTVTEHVFANHSTEVAR